MKRTKYTPRRRGAALIIALVLLAVIGGLFTVGVQDSLLHARKAQRERIRAQVERLLDDGRARAALLPDLDTETIVIPADDVLGHGVFRLSTEREKTSGKTRVRVEYRDANDRIVYAAQRDF